MRREAGFEKVRYDLQMAKSDRADGSMERLGGGPPSIVEAFKGCLEFRKQVKS